MRHIAIYTHWNIPNYGTYLQAYALQRVIDNICLTDDVKQIAYVEKTHLDLYYGFISEAKANYKFFLVNPKFYILLLKKIKNFNKTLKSKKFISYYDDIKNTGELTDDEFKKKYFDCVIVGSDIIWDYNRTIYKMDPRFFGVNLKSNKIVAYAASFGSAKGNSIVPRYVNDGLRKIDFISVRDNNSYELVKKISGKTSKIVIDPTFLWDFMNDDKIPDKPVDYKYIVVYGSYFTRSNIIEIKKYAQKHSLKIVCLDSLRDRFKWCDITITQDKMHPFLWCSYIKNAEVVMTCTYHGLILSLIYKRRIVMNPLPFILDKASSFIEYLGLNDVLTGDGSFSEKADWDWNYNIIEKKINTLKKESLNFLETALSKNIK